MVRAAGDGVAAAALNYFVKSLDELSLEEVAYLAALPKGPNNYNPSRHYDAAIARRYWVLDRMAEEGYVTVDDAEAARMARDAFNEGDEVATVIRKALQSALR